MNNQTDVSIKFKNSVTGEKKLQQYAQTLSTIKSVLDGMDKGAAQQLEKSSRNVKEADTNMQKMSKNFNIAFNYTALRTFARGLGKVVEGFSSMTAKSTAFLEDFNLFQVAFRGNYTEATKFVNKLSEMYGLDEDWLIKTTSQFKQLSNAMGLAEETGERVSKLMTEMAIDISSLYNIDVERSSSILQSALAGQTKPVRSLGADITQATLQQTLDRLDISSQVSQLSYAEKRLLIMISLTQQLSGVTNDWGRTLESPSNQIRIMNEQWERLQRNVGNIFLQIVGKVLPYLNAVLMVLNEIAKIIASLFGYKIDDFDFFDESAVGGIEDFGEALDGASESAKKLKQGLRGFDKLNVISTSNASSGGAGVGGGINPKLMEAFNKAFDDYQKKLSDVQMKATKIRDTIMEWLGFTKIIDEETGEVSFKFDHITGGTVLGALAVGGSIYNGIRVILKTLNRIGLIKFTNLKGISSIFTKLLAVAKLHPALLLISGAIVGIGSALIYAYKHNDIFKEKVDKMVSDLREMFDALSPYIKEIFGEIYEIIKMTWDLIIEVVKFSGGVVYETIIYVFSGIIDVISGTARIIKDIANGDWKQAHKDLLEVIKSLKENTDRFYTAIGQKIIDLAKSIWDILSSYNWTYLGYSVMNGIFGGIVGAINWKQLNDIGSQIFNGIFDGMFSFKPKLSGWASSFVKGIKDALGIHSPAKLILDAKIGDYSMEAISLGMERQLPQLKNQAEDIVNTLRNGVQEASIDSNFNYNIPSFNQNSLAFASLGLGNDNKGFGTTVSPTIIVQVGNKEIARQVITDLQGMAKDNGKPIVIGG